MPPGRTQRHSGHVVISAQPIKHNRVLRAQSLTREDRMATVDECRNVLEKMAGKVAKKSGELDLEDGFERTLAVEITDLGQTFSAKLAGGKLADLLEGDAPDAEVRILLAS